MTRMLTTFKTSREQLEYYREYMRAYRKKDGSHKNLLTRVKQTEEQRIISRKKSLRKWRAKNKEKYNVIALRTRKKWRLKYPDRYYAHNKVRYALKKGALIPQPCEICGVTKTQAHHDDYSKPLQVRWLCSKHHTDFHMKE